VAVAESAMMAQWDDVDRVRIKQEDATPQFGGRLPVDVATMADSDDHDDQIRILNFVQDAVVPLSKTE